MSLQDTPAAERPHIAFFGIRNAGKSSLVNAVTGQNLSIVSDTAGTTTDPVKKAMELLPLGPVVIIDTPGIDDEGALGKERVARTHRVLDQTDVAVLAIDGTKGLQAADEELITVFNERRLPYLLAITKADIAAEGSPYLHKLDQKNRPSLQPLIKTSARTGEGIRELKEAIATLAGESSTRPPLLAGQIKAGDTILLVIPIDKSAPKGRLILPQQMMLRAVLDAGARPMACRNTEYAAFLSELLAGPATLRPALVITDSQVFAEIRKATPKEIPLTTFSIEMARYKGTLAQAQAAADVLDRLKDGDTVLISEGCTHHRQCEDIGTVKLPQWIRDYTKKDLRFVFTSGGEFPDDLSGFSLILHCGGCMLNEREMRSRAKHALDENVPMTNYGVAIAEIHGILDRCVKPLL